MRSNKRKLCRWGCSLGILLCTSGYSAPKGDRDVGFSFGVIADCQYFDTPGTGMRKYAASKEKLKNCVDDFNTLNLEYVVSLGDFIDRDFDSFDEVIPIYNQLQVPHYHVLGNHDFSVEDDLKKKVPQKMGMASTYYDFEVKGWRFIVLDGNDISFNAHPEGSQEYADATQYYMEHNIKSPKWNGAVGARQLAWLRATLKEATQQNENVIIYCHFPVFPKNIHNLWNAEELMALLAGFSCVKAYINGHNHKGGYGMRDGIHYVTLRGMLDTEQTSYAVIRVDGESIDVTGYGREENRTMVIGRSLER